MGGFSGGCSDSEKPNVVGPNAKAAGECLAPDWDGLMTDITREIMGIDTKGSLYAGSARHSLEPIPQFNYWTQSISDDSAHLDIILFRE